MSVQKIPNINFEIQVKVTWVESESQPEQNMNFFSYRVHIVNKGAETAQLLSRHWIITDDKGHTEEVRGPGVVGQQPRIQPGQAFEYESACPLNSTSGSMKGTYQMITNSGHSFDVTIPEFYLIAPSALH